ncbi:MAG: membrane protein insertion efficiency factor YidD [Candidatus Latescibacterota bacterium]|nr:MAG: membrane protein insertion efficiency factor YidD [Candidatus Latescibacterota bacterium]
MSIFDKPVIKAIAVYQRLVSPFLPASCRFYPSCSDYAKQSIERHGTLRGAFYSIRRVCRCHPWHPGGYDPAD